jgi:hypothetical protein
VEEAKWTGWQRRQGDEAEEESWRGLLMLAAFLGVLHGTSIGDGAIV